MYVNVFLNTLKFKLKEKTEVTRKISKSDYIRYSSTEISTINTANSQIYLNIPREDSVVSLLNSYNDLNFAVLHAASGKRHADNNDTRLINLGLIACSSKNRLRTSSGKHLKDISVSHIVSLMYKLITSPGDTADLSIGFGRDRGRKQRELTNNKTQKGKFHVRVMLKTVLGFAEHPKKLLMD